MELIPSPSSDPRADALAVVQSLRANGHVAYFAGGCVRDALLGLTPKDYDVATDAPPDRVRKIFPRTQAVGAAFGVILVRQGKTQVEVATFRADGVYLDGRRPDSVRYSDAEDDAKRRDFTINGLFLDPIENRVIDHVNGQVDLGARVLRAIGDPDARFAEDHLRILRAVRFAARFNLTIEPATEAAIRRHVDQLRRISPERIADELRRMLTPATRADAWRTLLELGLLDELFRLVPVDVVKPLAPARSIFLNIGSSQPKRVSIDADKPDAIPFPLALAATALCFRWQQSTRPVTDFLTYEEVRRLTRILRQTFKLSNDESDTLGDALEGAGSILAEPFPNLARQKRFRARPAWALSCELLGAFRALDIDADKVERILTLTTAISDADASPPPLVTGDDLTALGYAPGPKFKRVLYDVYDAQLEATLTDKTTALESARRALDGA